MTELITTTIVALTAIIAYSYLFYLRFRRRFYGQTNLLMDKINKIYYIALTIQRRVEEIEETIDKAADLKECIDVLRKDNDYNNNEPTN